MKVRIFGYDETVDINEGLIGKLVIENRGLYRSIVNEIYKKNSGEKLNSIVFIENEKEIDCKKDMIVISDIYNYEFNQKNIIGKIKNLRCLLTLTMNIR